MHSLSQCQVASIGQWGLDKLFTDSEVLEAIVEVTVRELNLKLLNRVLDLVVKVEPHMVKPVKVIDACAFLGNQEARSLSLMHQISN